MNKTSCIVKERSSQRNKEICNNVHVSNSSGGKKDSSRLIKVCEFLIDCGWHKAAGELLNHLYQTMNPLSERHNVLVVLTHLISTHIAECKFTKAKEAFVKASTFYDTSKDKRFNAGLLYAEEAYRHYCLSNFAEADDWADRALLEVCQE